MHTAICDDLDIEFPIFAFTHCRDVVVAVSKAGGFGVLGAVRFNDPADLDAALTYMDENTDGKPYGVDIVMPAKIPTEGTPKDLSSLVPQGHKEFVERTLLKLGVPPLSGESGSGVPGWLHSVARSHVDVALGHRISLIANALGSPPADVIEQMQGLNDNQGFDPDKLLDEQHKWERQNGEKPE